MSLLVIHLTDVHLDEKSSAFCDRAELIIDAALSPMTAVSALHIVLSGDIANKTAPKDFDVARDLFSRLKGRVVARLGFDPKFLISAGNHDCDFAEDQSVRDALLSVARAKPQSISDQIVNQLASVLNGFYQFQIEVSPPLNYINKWCAIVEFSELNVRYVLLNSSVMSTIKEDPGRLFIPVPDVDVKENVKTIFVMHHPYGWLMPDNARELAQYAAMTGDLFLMGHEHELWAQQVSDLYDDSAITYLRGHVLYEGGENSAFQTILIDNEKGFCPRSYVWRGGSYESWVEKSRDDFIQWPVANGNRKLSISADGFRFLNMAGANFSHRRKDVVTLQDIFVWPLLKRGNLEKDTGNLIGDGLSIGADELIFESRFTSVCVLKGGDQAGKTSLLKMLAMQLGKKGCHPLLLSASSISSWRSGALEDRINDAIDQLYGKRWRADYKKLDMKEKVLLIDDFDLTKIETGCLQGLRALRQHFGKVYIAIGSHPGIEVALSEFLRDENFIDSEVFEIIPCTQHHRLEIIERWLMIGHDGVGDIDDLKMTAAKLLKVVDETLGRNLIPAVPIFVLIILQRAELVQDLNTVVKSGSHGFLYESLIAQALSNKVTDCNLVTSMTYLTALAKLLDQRKSDDLEQAEFDTFHVEHCQRFKLKLPLNSLQGQLVGAEILEDKGGRVCFRYPYHHYYFLARSLSQMDWHDLESRIDALVGMVHTEKNANVLLFLAHLGRNPKIAHKILLSASRMFDSYVEADLFSRSSVLDRYKPMEIRQILFEGNKASQLEQRQLDEYDDEKATEELAKVAEDRLKARIDDALLMNAAFKTLQVLGQVLRNHAGEIESEEKQQMAEACVGLGLRVMDFINSMIAAHGDEMVFFRGLQIKSENPAMTDSEVANELENYLPAMMSSLTTGTLIKIANAIGSEDLALTIDDVLDGSNTRKLIKLIVHLEHFSDFPKKEILDFEADALQKGAVLPNSVLRRFIIRRFYLFPVRDELKRAVLDRFKINARPFQFLEQRKLPRH
ncbi:metallophosphoesterase family protein [Lysobacter sp. 1R34A]|uniref:metallophosphoesterase family protein n=1 Tax=Lysobacter sp. 1R34A TaxID=3445786 RepID=UPI003EE8526A